MSTPRHEPQPTSPGSSQPGPMPPHPASQAPASAGPGGPVGPVGPGGPASPGGPTGPVGRKAFLNGALSLRPQGLWLVTSLELRQRLRSKRWYIALAIWTLVLLGIGGLGLLPVLYSGQWDQVSQTSAVVFSLQVILVLFAMLLVVPALSAGSINGDRTAGTLATLQASLLSPLEIVLGRLLAGFLTGLAFQVLALPSIVPIAVLGEIGLLYFLRVMLMISLLTLCVTAVGLGLSAMTNRQLGSVVLAYVIVFGATVVLPVAWVSTTLFIQQEKEVTEYSTEYIDTSDGGTEQRCEKSTRTRTIPRVDLTMPLMWGNPVVLLAETAPPLPEDSWNDDSENEDVLRYLKQGMRAAATIDHPANNYHCSPEDIGYSAELDREVPNRPVWPMGVALWMLAGGLSLAVATWKLAVPIRRLGAGTRIA